MEEMVMQTFSGRFVNIADLKKEDIIIRDMARSLSNQCRYGGHTREFYSVAEHSVIASNLIEQFCIDYPNEMLKLMGTTDGKYKKASIDLIGATLMHDAPEAYLSDVITPIKKKLNEYMEIEEAIHERVEEILQLTETRPEQVPAIKAVDDLMLCIESVSLLPDSIRMLENIFPRLPKFMQDWFKEADKEYLDWAFPVNPLLPNEAMDAFMARFYTCFGNDTAETPPVKEVASA